MLAGAAAGVAAASEAVAAAAEALEAAKAASEAATEAAASAEAASEAAASAGGALWHAAVNDRAATAALATTIFRSDSEFIVPGPLTVRVPRRYESPPPQD